jgi:putative glutathione S-transferase
MGQLVNGSWTNAEAAVPTQGGAFARPQAVFNGRVEPGGRFPPQARRYHLYASLACPWAHRTLIFRRLKGLESKIGLSITHWLMADEGWTFVQEEGVRPDPFGARALHEIYTRADSNYTGRVSVPVLWDTMENTIVSNESADIIRMFNSGFDEVGAEGDDYYPRSKRAEIDALNERIYATVNNGVYKAGFARTQEAHHAAIAALFDTLDWLEARLSLQRYLTGDQITEADWRLFTTLVRFDAVYHGHFKCNVRRLVDYPALLRLTRSLYQVPGVAETVNFEHIKHHYYLSHPWLDPTGIVPVGPAQDFSQPEVSDLAAGASAAAAAVGTES